jgi:flagellar biosynthetic protein FliR
MGAFDLFAKDSPATLVLVAARVMGLMLIAPSLSATIVPRLVKIGMILLFTVLLQPAVLPFVDNPQLTPATIAGEVLVGLAMGLGAALIVGAAETAGDLMAVQIGLSGTAILDPMDNSQLPSLGVFTRLFAVTMLLTLGLHETMLRAMAESFVAMPPGASRDLMGGLQQLVSSGSTLFILGLRFAAPVIAVVLLTNVALAILSRAAPQFNLLSVSFPVQISLGLFALAAALPAMGRTLSTWPTAYREIIARIGEGFVAVAR